MSNPLPSRVRIVEVGPREEPSGAKTALANVLREGGADVELRAVRLPPFWSTVGLTDCSDLIALTRDWLTNA